MLHARDVMTRDVISIRPDATVVDAARLMIKHKISAVPVLEGGRLTGIISEGDLVHRAEIGTAEKRRSWWLRLLSDTATLADDYTRSHSRRVGDVMTRRVYTIAEITPVAKIAELLDRHQIKRAPVLRGENVVGIVSRADLLKAIVVAADAIPHAPMRDDLAIRARLMDELNHERWATTVGTNIEVHDGIVSLWGNVSSEGERRATRVLAENVPGVRDVEDHRIILDFPIVAL